MSTSFYGFQIAKTGLFASQKGLEVVGNNVANSKTKGYSRQVLDLSSIPPPYTNQSGGNTRSAVGGGVLIENVDQCRDAFLDTQFRQQNGILGEAQTRADGLSYIEDLFNNTTDAGIDDVLNTFFDSLEELSKSPESDEVRTLVRQNASSVIDTFHYFDNQFESLQSKQDVGVTVTVGKINTLASQINDLNSQIIKYEATGSHANELRDKRNDALDELSGLVDIQYSEDDSGSVSVTFGSNKESLVDNTGAHLLTAVQNLPDYYGNSNTFNSIYLESGDTLNAADLTGGSLKGYLDMRDGDTNLNMGIPYFMDKLNNLAKGLITSINTIHEKGYTYPSESNGNVSETGVDFFDPDNLNAKTMSLDSKILASPSNIAASSVVVSSEQASGDQQTGNNETVLDLLDILKKNDLPVIANVNQYYKGIVSDIAVQASYSNDKIDNETLLLDNIQYKRVSVSGVSIDEEMTNMMIYQKSYAAASRVITTMDDQLDTLINRTGLVGR